MIRLFVYHSQILTVMNTDTGELVTRQKEGESGEQGLNGGTHSLAPS